MSTRKHERKWWKEAVVYQIYPSTFLDTNSDGIGDLPGITSKLDYLASLGVTVLWISPHYQSPQIDMGYDISSFEDIHAPYGSLADCQTHIDETHKRGMKIIFDLVINHVSDQHKWFLESRSSRDNPKRDWFFWRPARIGPDGERSPPNNWRSQFTVPAWTWDEKTQEYYFHIYAPQMPDLNWENPDCRKAIYDSAIRFWLDRGIDGFRIDTVNKYSKDVSFPDAEVSDPGEVTQPAMKHYSNGPRMREFLLEMNAVFSKYDIMTVGELPNTPRASDVLAYVSAAKQQLNMVFNFDVVALGQTPSDRLRPAPFTMADFTRQLSRWQTFVIGTDAWTTVFLENHDQGRSISRFGDDSSEEMRARSGKMLAMVLASMTGTLFLYQGQEIGMTNIPRDWPAEEYKDIRSVNFYGQIRERTAGDKDALGTALKGMQKVARDNARLPIQWSAAPNAGFCDEGATPWMRVHDDFATLNVEKQEREGEDSVLGFWKRMLELRTKHKDLWVYGDYRMLETDVEQVFAFVKTLEGGEDGGKNGGTVSVTLANLSKESRKVPGVIKDLLQARGPLRCVAYNTSLAEQKDDMLVPWEGRIYVSGA